MLYKLKSKVTGDVIMLQPNAQRMLEIIGKHTAADPSIKGILLPEQMPHALEALQAAITHDETQRKEASAQALEENLPEPRFEEVSLRQRALPFMEMIRSCLKEDVAITWGV